MPLSRLDLRGVPTPALGELLPRPAGHEFPTEEVAAIIEEVRRGGDEALARLTARFDGVKPSSLKVDPAVVSAAVGAVPAELRRALEVAFERIVAYHAHEPDEPDVFADGGVVVRHLRRPVARAGLYAPGGRARYPSTVLMAAAPARVAGVGEVALCVPPGPDGEIAVETLAAAAVAGVYEIYRVGGAQAVAAMAFGTETIAPVDVVAGPGNRYVAEAKRQLSGLVGVPSAFAGPSEVVVVADDSTPPVLGAVDLAVQAEHGPDGMAWLVSWSAAAIEAIDGALWDLMARSPRRAELEATIATGGVAVLVDDADQAMAVANEVAPEHLELLVADAEALLPRVRRAGAVFVGINAPASLGDYVAGPNHVLPTARSARFSSALRVDDFRTFIHAVSVDDAGLAELGTYVVTLAEAEGLDAHAQSMRLRGVGR